LDETLMSRTVVEARIQDRTARGRLEVRNKPYWRQLSEGAHIGYRKGARKGTWFARFHCETSNAYVSSAIGEADDTRDADDLDIFTYKQAFERAQRWIELARKGTALAEPVKIVMPQDHGDLTVGRAVDAYVALRDARRSHRAGRALHSDAYYTLTRFVRADLLANVSLTRLTVSDLQAWQLRIQRSRASSIQRVVNDLKAALNAAFRLHREKLPGDLPVTIEYGLKVESTEMLVSVARENQILTDEQVRRVVAAAIGVDEDLGRLVVLLAATGARFSQIARMRVGDVQAEYLRVLVPQSFKGKKRSVEYTRVQVGADTLATLAPITTGRPAAAPLLERWRLRQTAPMEWERVERGPWATSSEMTRLWKRAVAKAGLPDSTIPYALRHSSIVRGLRFGLPIRLVAALHDTSVAMIERHYSRWITEGLDELAARAVVPIVSIAA
jgi:integrase